MSNRVIDNKKSRREKIKEEEKQAKEEYNNQHTIFESRACTDAFQRD